MFYQESDMNNILLYWDSVIWISKDWYWNCRNLQSKDVNIMCYTTIEDREWNNIFEWDIVQSIVWLRWIVRFWFHTLPVAEYDWERTIWYFVDIWWLEKSLWDWIFDRRRVVWNIYQNSELLSEK